MWLTIACSPGNGLLRVLVWRAAVGGRQRGLRDPEQRQHAEPGAGGRPQPRPLWGHRVGRLVRLFYSMRRGYQVTHRTKLIPSLLVYLTIFSAGREPDTILSRTALPALKSFTSWRPVRREQAVKTGRTGLLALLEFQLETCQERTGCEDR